MPQLARESQGAFRQCDDQTMKHSTTDETSCKKRTCGKKQACHLHLRRQEFTNPRSLQEQIWDRFPDVNGNTLHRNTEKILMGEIHDSYGHVLLLTRGKKHS